MIYKPQPHQVTAIRRLLDTPYCSLFALPGSGKTSIALSVLKITGARALIVAPLQTVLSSWPDEINKWDQFKNLDIATAHGKDKEKAFDHQIVLINPEGLKWLIKNKKLLKNFDTLIVDESTKFKNWMSKRARILRKLCPLFHRRHILTGTPTPRSLIDWFSQQNIVDDGASFGKYITHFKSRHFYQVGFKFKIWEPKEGTLEKLSHLAKQYVHVVDHKGLDIPESRLVDKIVSLPDDVVKKYKSMERELVADVLGERHLAASNGVAYGMCRQILAGALYNDDGHTVLHRAKWVAAASLIDELNGAPVVVFYQYTFEADEMIAEIGQSGVAEISGRVPVAERAGVIARWNRGEIRVLLIQASSGAHGLNLQGGGHHMIWLTVTDDPEVYAQANRRMRRLSAEHDVIIYRILISNTLETVCFGSPRPEKQSVTDRQDSRAARQDALVKYCQSIQ